MFSVRSKSLGLFVMAILLIFAGSKCDQIVLARSDNNPDDARLKKLLKERVSARKEIVDAYDRLGNQVASKLDVAAAKVKLLLAELDLCETKNERVAVHERIVEQKKIIEHGMSSVGPKLIDSIASRADRIESESALERERLK